jgi:DNA topoisomerase-1
LEKASKGAQLLGHHPDSGEPIYLAHGRFGAYVQLGETPARGSKEPKPRRASLPKDTAEEEATLQLALKWLSLPRTLGIHPDSDEEVMAASGRFGPYIKCGSETRSLPATDDIYEVELARALEILAQPKARRGQRRVTRKALRDFGEGEAGKIQLMDGPYGPYLTNGELNASLPKGTATEKLDRPEAVRILNEHGKKPKRGRRRRSK